MILPFFFTGKEASFAADAPAKPAPAQSSSLIKFQLPKTGTAKVRLTGGSRGTGEKAVTLDVLAPAETGHTTQEQPSLFWYQSRPAAAKFELTLVQENKIKPLVHVTIDRAGQAGIQRLKLSDHNVKLVPDVEYQWVVALISDPDNRSTDLVASGVITRVAQSAELKQKLANSTPEARAAAYAEAGIWYDALAALSDQIDANPANRALREARADLLRQVGLTAAAKADAGEPSVAGTEAK